MTADAERSANSAWLDCTTAPRLTLSTSACFSSGLTRVKYNNRCIRDAIFALGYIMYINGQCFGSPKPAKSATQSVPVDAGIPPSLSARIMSCGLSRAHEFHKEAKGFPTPRGYRRRLPRPMPTIGEYHSTTDSSSHNPTFSAAQSTHLPTKSLSAHLAYQMVAEHARHPHLPTAEYQWW